MSNNANPFACATSLAQTLVPSAQEVEKDAALDAGGKTPSLALEWLLDDAEAVAKQARVEEEKQHSFQKVENLVKRLCIADPIRSRYWQYRLAVLTSST